ncbi:MAG: YggT family protein [Gammaproteobacteria bacterium]|nr:YggT family protein [Gammaproteobacteria bacterium]
MTNPLLLILNFAVNVFALFCLLRFLLQLAKANFYSPIVESIKRITDPVLQPIRKFLPTSGQIDLASLIAVLILFSISEYLLTTRVAGDALGILPIWAFPWNGAVEAVKFSIWIYLVAILISVIMSWIAPNIYSPAAELARQLADPFLAPIRKFLPSMAGFDFSPMIAMFVLLAVQSYVLPYLRILPSTSLPT